ncbi:hypothetical protein [Priestia megaterium]
MFTDNKAQKEDKYDDCLVAFIDILGFKNIVQQSKSDSEYFKQVLTALKDIEHVVNHNQEKIQNEKSQVQMTQFSDSLVISRPNTRESLFPMIMNLNFVQKILAKKGIMIRGGLTSGPLYHRGAVAFGPAFIRAYELESNIALYPRIIVDPSLLGESPNLDANAEVVDNMHIHIMKMSTLKQDSDRYYFINFLGDHFSDLDDAEKLEEVIHQQLSQLTGNDDRIIRVRHKLEWMLNYINSVK